MFTTSQRKHSLAAPVEFRSLWTHDRDTWQPGGLAGMHRAFEHAFDAYEVLQTDLQTFERVDRRFDGVDGSLVDTKALLHRQRSGEFTRNGKPSLNPPYLAGNYRSGNLSASQSALGGGTGLLHVLYVDGGGCLPRPGVEGRPASPIRDQLSTAH